jgi:hypothetical protein
VDPSVRQQPGWSPGLRLDPPVPIVARTVWEDDGEEYIETGADAEPITRGIRLTWPESIHQSSSA